MMTQNQRIMDYVREHGSITPMEAMDLGIMRLAARIGELEKAGNVFGRESVRFVTRDGRPGQYMRYRRQEDGGTVRENV